MLFPSPAELKLIEIMGGKIVTINWLRHPNTDFPLAFVWSLGRALSSQHFNREVRSGKYYIDFGNDILWGIEVDGKNWHRDIVREYDRGEYLTGFCNKQCPRHCNKHGNLGWRIKHIPAVRLWAEPAVVQVDLLRFLNT